jgi:2-dehydropantoate 2-reductase
MKVLIVGAGGVGGYLAGVFVRSGIDVTLFATPKTNEFIAKNGLKIKDFDKEFLVSIKTELSGIYDVIIIAVKSYHLDDVLEIIKTYSNKNTIILPLLNGVGHFEKLKFNLKKGCIYIVSHKKDINFIEKKSPLFYLCYEKDEKLDTLFSKTDLKVKSSENIDVDVWKKYLFIATFATLTSYYQKPMGWVIENREDEVIEFVKRMLNLAKNLGINLDEKKEIEKIIKQAKNIPYDSKTSMQIDFEKGNKTELENLVGFLKNDEFIAKFYKKLNSIDYNQ